LKDEAQCGLRGGAPPPEDRGQPVKGLGEMDWPELCVTDGATTRSFLRMSVEDAASPTTCSRGILGDDVESRKPFNPGEREKSRFLDI